jgi:hypothetical protein
MGLTQLILELRLNGGKMKRFLAVMFLAVGISQAGPLKVASYPIRHPLKTEKAVATSLYKAIKAIVW